MGEGLFPLPATWEYLRDVLQGGYGPTQLGQENPVDKDGRKNTEEDGEEGLAELIDRFSLSPDAQHHKDGEENQNVAGHTPGSA